MERNRFLGSTDLNVCRSLLTDYNLPNEIYNCVKLNQVKQQDNLVLIELGSLLTTDECDEIFHTIAGENFEDMSEKYDIQKRNSSRLVVMDNQLADILWQRLQFNYELTELVSDTTPLGFNVQGRWTMTGVNLAMRLNKYDRGEHFSPHKDAQYAPSGDERSLLSLIIYLNDCYEGGETNFYFPKQMPKIDIKGLTVTEEIDAYGGLENGFECVKIQPKKGFAVLFTHNLLHEATPFQKMNRYEYGCRLVLRTDVLVRRTEKPLGFAVCSDEEEDYLACLNYFREAQQMELNSSKETLGLIDQFYERSLSIRYCYPRLLQIKQQQQQSNSTEEKSLVDRLPTEIWLKIWNSLHEQDVQYFIFAYPKFQTLKIVWNIEEKKNSLNDPSLSKFIPSIEKQYGCQTLFRFRDSEFFSRHIDGCCRVAAVYAFFLLGHRTDATSYIVRYNLKTQEVCEVQKERILTDVFYNRNCYGSLYRVYQKDNKQRQPSVDFDHSVDRMYLINRHQAQFIGQDLCARMSSIPETKQTNDDDDENSGVFYARKHALVGGDAKILENKIVDKNLKEAKHPEISYREYSTKTDSSTSIFRMISAKNYHIAGNSGCSFGDSHTEMFNINEIIRYYNYLVFDFNTHQLIIERRSDDQCASPHTDILFEVLFENERSSKIRRPSSSHYRVNIEKLAKMTKGFNHASCECFYPNTIMNEFSFLDYTYLKHVDLCVTEHNNSTYVLATYVGTVAL